MYRTVFDTREEARIEIFVWIQWYNRERRHLRIGDISPTELPQVSYVESCIDKLQFRVAFGE